MYIDTDVGRYIRICIYIYMCNYHQTCACYFSRLVSCCGGWARCVYMNMFISVYIYISYVHICTYIHVYMYMYI